MIKKQLIGKSYSSIKTDFFEMNCLTCGKKLIGCHEQANGFCKNCQDKMGLIDENELHDLQLERDTNEAERVYPEVNFKKLHFPHRYK